MKVKNRVLSAFCALLLLSVSIVTPTYTVNAADKWDEDSISKGDTVYVGDTICSIYDNTSIVVSYYDASNNLVKDDYEPERLTVRAFKDNKTDAKYVAYKVTNWTMDNTTFHVTLKGIRRNSYVITAGSGPNGTISYSGSRDVFEGEDITYTMTPDKGYCVDNVIVDGADQGAITTYKFKDVKAAHSIIAYFKKGTTTTTPTVTSPTPSTSGQTNHVSTLNLKGTQLTSWASIATKLDTLKASDLSTGGSCLALSVSGPNCYIDQNTIKHFNARKGMIMMVAYGTDASFTFFSDLDNSPYTGTNLAYTSSILNVNGTNQKRIVFNEPGMIGTAICVNVLLPNAVPGQTAKVYLEDASGRQTLYVPVTVDANRNVTFAIIGKVTLVVAY